MTFEAHLASVDWSSLSHAYGSADDVPELLRWLVGEDEGRRRDALYALYGNIYHQGSIYSATPPAAEALVLALKESERFVEPVIELLLHLVSGYGEDREATRLAAGKHPEVLARLLSQGSDRARSLVPFLVAHTGVDGAAELLRRDFAGMPLQVRVSRALALAHVADEVESLAKEEKEPAVRLALALAAAKLAHAKGEDPRALADAARNPLAWRALLESLPENAEMAIDLPPELLSDLPAELACPFLIGAAEACAELEDEDLVFRIVERIIPVGLRRQTEFDPNALSEDERTLLSHVLLAEGAFSVANTEMYLSEQLGITRSLDTREMLLGALGIRLPTSLYLMRPRDLASAARTCDEVGEPRWKDATFVFSRGPTDFLDVAIPEDPEDWPEEVMAKGRTVAQALMEGWIWPLGIRIDTYRFYPDHDADALERIGREAGAQVERPAPPAAQSEEESEGEIDGLEWPFLDDDFSGPYEEHHFEVAARAGELLEAAGFQEARGWRQGFESMAKSGITMHPIALGKRFGTAACLVVGVDVFSAAARAGFERETGEPLPELMLSITATREEGGAPLTIKAGLREYEAALSALGSAAEDYLSSADLVPILAAIAPHCRPLLAALGGGRYAALVEQL